MTNIFLKRPVVHILLIIILGLIAYSNTLHFPFHFDDNNVITRNPIIKNFQYFTSPSKAKVLTENFGYNTFRRRYIGYLTFALNYSLHSLDTTGYHIFNISVHIINALFVYLIVVLTFRTPFLRDSRLGSYSSEIAFFTGILFVCHPVQTQAVTYIWQRVTSLATLFFLLSMVSYIQWRLLCIQQHCTTSDSVLKKMLHPFYLICIVSAICAMKTKEIAFMIPVSVMLYEIIFFKEKVRSRILYLAPILLTLLIIPLTLIDVDKPLGELIGEVNREVRGSSPLSRWHYLLAQFRVIVTYIRLIFVPVHQNLDYDYPQFRSFFEGEVFVSFLFLLSLFAVSSILFFRYRKTVPPVRIIFYCTVWFFINLLIESSIIPLDNVIFEHRVYLPSIGVFFLLTTLCFIIIEKQEKQWKRIKNIIMPVLFAIIIVLTGATYARNAVWTNEITMWEDIVSKSPNKGRAHTGLGKAYKSQGLFSEAIEQYNIALRLNPYDLETYNNLGNAYSSLGQFDTAIHYLRTALKFKSNFADTRYNLGHVYQLQGLMDKAIKEYKIAISLNPYFAKAHNNIGYAYKAKGFTKKALKHFQTATELDFANVSAHVNLGDTYITLGFIDNAIKEYQTALKINPRSPRTHNKLGSAYQSKGMIDKANEHFRNAQRLDPSLLKKKDTQN